MRGDGPTVVIDPLWGEPVAAAVEAAAPRARIVNFGQSAGAEATLKSGRVRSKELELLGLSNFARRSRSCAPFTASCSRPRDPARFVSTSRRSRLDDVDEAWRRQAPAPRPSSRGR
jgi:NADPH:quinone reductase-like Zn-dependent oxidoreductase